MFRKYEKTYFSPDAESAENPVIGNQGQPQMFSVEYSDRPQHVNII